MEKYRNPLTKKILNLALEILYLLTGEDYGPINRKKSSNHVTSSSHCHVSGEWWRSQISSMESPPHSKALEVNNEKILEVTKRIIELLTGEVPIRCQDVAVYLSMEEREYLEGHSDLYKVAMMEEEPPLTPRGGADVEASPGGSPRPPHSQQIKAEDITETQVEASLNIIVVDNVHKPAGGGEAVCLPTVKEEEGPVHIASDHEVTYYLSQNSLELPSHDTLPQEEHAVSSEAAGGRKQIFCPDCGKCFSRLSHYVIHERIHSGEKPYACSECGKSFSCNSYLAKHQRSHTGERPYCCSECGKQFNQSSNLFKHQKTHTGQKPFACALCGKSFVQKSHLVIHQIVHTGEKRFPCSECGKSFSNNARLVAHIRVHTGEKPFGCPLCDKRFTQKSHLAKHNIVHTGEKPFTCDQCGKSFISNSHLVIHQRTHSGEKPYSCSLCHKRFTQKSDLVRHEKTHGGDRPFPCPTCGKRFLCKAYLAQHEKIHVGKPR